MSDELGDEGNEQLQPASPVFDSQRPVQPAEATVPPTASSSNKLLDAASIEGVQPEQFRSTRNALVVSAAIVGAGVISLLATISHGWEQVIRPVAIATSATLFGLVPPLLISKMMRNVAAKQLLVVAWRLGIMLLALLLATRFLDEERKWYLNTLLACYFVALPLESWLLIVDARRPLKNDSSL